MNIIISADGQWRLRWQSFLELVKNDSIRFCKDLATFSKQRISSETTVYIDASSIETPNHLPFNLNNEGVHCYFVLVNMKKLSDAALLHYLKLGYSGVIEVDSKPEDILRALEILSRTEVWFPRRIVEKAVRDYQSCSVSQEQVIYEIAAAYNLSKREQQVCLELIDGSKNSDIGKKLFISTHTVKCHVTSLYRKLRVNSRNEVLSAINKRMNHHDHEKSRPYFNSP